MGSSPRMRGSRTGTNAVVSGDGIIPAHAGLTRSASCAIIQHGDHPRACGAHKTHVDFSSVKQGSSPRMRGSPPSSPSMETSSGIIPAHAGLTLFSLTARRRAKDHPRACGAHRTRHLSCMAKRGSSPRMRGSRSQARLKARDRGIIPAHAGLTMSLGPCLCGALGSSPRMRGSPSRLPF